MANSYEAIIRHRSIYYAIKGVDYTSHYPLTLNFIPPRQVMLDWEKDYETMKRSFIYGDASTFEHPIKRMKELTTRFRNMVLSKNWSNGQNLG